MPSHPPSGQSSGWMMVSSGPACRRAAAFAQADRSTASASHSGSRRSRMASRGRCWASTDSSLAQPWRTDHTCGCGGRLQTGGQQSRHWAVQQVRTHNQLGRAFLVSTAWRVPSLHARSQASQAGQAAHRVGAQLCKGGHEGAGASLQGQAAGQLHQPADRVLQAGREWEGQGQAALLLPVDHGGQCMHALPAHPPSKHHVRANWPLVLVLPCTPTPPTTNACMVQRGGSNSQRQAAHAPHRPDVVVSVVGQAQDARQGALLAPLGVGRPDGCRHLGQQVHGALLHLLVCWDGA